MKKIVSTMLIAIVMMAATVSAQTAEQYYKTGKEADDAKDYATAILAIDVNVDTTEMLDVTWGLFRKYFKLEEVNIKKEFTDIYWK